MANRTVKDAKSIRGTNPQYLVEKIIRSRIYDSKYWKEECFALTEELLVDKAMELRWVATSGGNIPPNAIPGGETEDGEPLFVGRIHHEGTLTIGKVQPSHNVLYIPFGGAEVAFPDYKILVSE